MPPATACPGAGWSTQQIVADNLINASVSPERPLFRYSGDAGLVTDTSDAARETIARVESTVIVDEDTTQRPTPTRLTTSVILRNQNRAPIARFTYTLLNPMLSPTTCSIQVNGSASEDPESKPLRYEWYVDDVKQSENGVVVQKVVSKGTHTYQLKVYDRADLMGASPTETHTC
jgi:hypothetical protein